MKRRLALIVLTLTMLSLIVGGLPAFAAAGDGQGNPPPNSAVKSFTDSAGNVVPPEEMAPNVTQKKTPGGSEANWQVRGRDWWPYPNQEPPYSVPAQRVEKMPTDDVSINGVVVLNTVTPEANLQNVPSELLLKPGSQLQQEAGYYIVKLEGRTRTGKEVAALEKAGATLGEYINVNAYVARIPSSAYGAVMSLPFVTYVGDYHPAYKISSRIGLTRVPQSEITDYGTGLPRPWLFELRLHAGADINAVVNGLNQLGIFVSPKDVVTSVNDKKLTTIMARFMPEKIIDVAKIPGVQFIQEHAFPILMASSTYPAAEPMLLQNNGVYTTNKSTGWKLWNEGLDGSKSGTAQIVTIMDSGLSTEMYHFSEDTVNVGTLGSSHRKVVGYDNYGGDTCVLTGGHGGKTSQRAVGSISNMTTNPDTSHTPNENWDDGIARGGKVYFQDIGTSTGSLNVPSDLGPSITAAIGKGSYIQNHSWGTSSNTYDTEASNLDAAIYSNPYMVVTVSAGNSGVTGQSTIGSPSTAKNCICVGGVDLAAPDYLFEDCNWDGTAACSGTTDNGSSRGPVATSGRIKPDICAYDYGSSSVGGENMADDNPHAMCQGDTSTYWDYVNTPYEGGTSFSAPEVAGVAAVVRDYFLSGYYPSGSATAADAITPSGSLVKAVILASGEPLNTTASPSSSIAIQTRYSNDQGYGRVNLPSVLRIGPGAPYLWVQNRDSLGDGATKTTYYTINGNSIPLRIIMDYYDAAGNALQKDCDLKVTIGSDVYWGNSFSGGWSVTGGSADHTNNTEGVFLDAAHGLPSSGTVQVDIIAYNDPGGMNYSLVVSGDVASQAVTQVSLDQGKYTCASTINITVNDASATSPVSVTMTSKDSGGTTIDTQSVSCTGSNGVFTGSIVAGTGLTVEDGGSVVAEYVDGGSTSYTATSTFNCQLYMSDGGYLIDGGCDSASDPSDNGWVNEYYTHYMDADEYNAYTFGFNNLTGSALTDVYVSLTFSGTGASHMQVLNNPVYVGPVSTSDLGGAVFQLYTDSSVAGLTDLTLNFAITSPADGYTTPFTILQTQILQTDDTISRHATCNTFTDSLGTYYESVLSGGVANPWVYKSNQTGKGEDRTDAGALPACGNSANGIACVGAPKTNTNFASHAFSFLLNNVQPELTGNGPNGQPYYFTWKWHSFYASSEAPGNTTGVWGVFYDPEWNSSTNPTADDAYDFPIADAWYYHSALDYNGSWDWDSANTGIPDDQSGNAPPNQLFTWFSNSVNGQATSSTWFSWGHAHADLYWFNGGTATTGHRDIAIDDDRLVYDEYYATAQSGPCSSQQAGVVAFDRFSYQGCSNTATISVVDANASSPLTVTVVSPGTGDSEDVTLTGSGPYFSGTLTISASVGGVSTNDGTLFVLPAETITASYTDVNPAATSVAYADTDMSSASIDLTAKTFVPGESTGDGDTYPDTNETFAFTITLLNNQTEDLTNVVAMIGTTAPSTQIDCIPSDTAVFGTIPASSSVSNPTGQEFVIHVNPSYNCTDPSTADKVTFSVTVSGDGFCASTSALSVSYFIDLNSSKKIPQPLTINLGSSKRAKSDIVQEKSGMSSGISFEKDLSLNIAKQTPSTKTISCGNSFYDDSEAENSAWFNAGVGVDDPDYMMGVLFDPADFSLSGVPYQITKVCFSNEHDWGASYPIRWYIYPDSSGTPDDSTVLYSGTQTTGQGGTGQVEEYTLSAAVSMSADQKFWVMCRGDSSLSAGDWNLDIDTTDPGIMLHSYVSNTGIAGLTVSDTSDYSIHVTMVPSLLCDDTDNSALAGCPSASHPPVVPNNDDVSGTAFKVTANGSNVDFTWDALSCTASDYMVLWGNVSSLSLAGGVTNGTVTSGDCGLGNTGSASNKTSPSPAAGECYFCVIDAVEGASFGRHGNNSNSNERVLSGDTTRCAGVTTKDTAATTCQ